MDVITTFFGWLSLLAQDPLVGQTQVASTTNPTSRILDHRVGEYVGLGEPWCSVSICTNPCLPRGWGGRRTRMATALGRLRSGSWAPSTAWSARFPGADARGAAPAIGMEAHQRRDSACQGFGTE